MRPLSIKTDPVVKGETESHGNFDIKTIHMGEYEVRITSPGYQEYKTELFFPSDFKGCLGVLLKKEKK